MKTSELLDLLTMYSGYTYGEIEQRTRPLRALDKIPHGPRGVHAPQLDYIHAAMILLTMVARRSIDAGPIAMRAADLKLVARPGLTDRLEGKPLVAVIHAALKEGAAEYSRIEVTTDGAMAWADFDLGKFTERAFFCDDPALAAAAQERPETYDAAGSHYAGHRYVITKGMISMLSMEMAESDDAQPARYGTGKLGGLNA